MQTKVCIRCKKSKNISEFHKHSRNSDGYRNVCKWCRRLRYAKNNSPKRYKRLKLLEQGKKRCPSCDIIKNLGEFSLSSDRFDGHHGYCKECRRLFTKQRYYSDIEASRRAGRERTRLWRRNPKNRDKTRKLARQYYHTHKEKRNEYQRKWRNGKGRDKFILQLQRRRSRKNGVENTLSAVEVEFLVFFQNNKCACCGIIFDDDYTMDHIIPLSLGGGLTLENIQLLCRSCNSSKGIKNTKYRNDITIESVICMI